MKSSKIINEKEIKTRLLAEVNRILNLQIGSEKESILTKNRREFNDPFQKLLLIDGNPFYKKIFLPFISNELIKYEALAAGSANLSLEIICGCLDHYIKESIRYRGLNSKVLDLNSVSDSWIKSARSASRYPDKKDLSKFIFISSIGRTFKFCLFSLLSIKFLAISASTGCSYLVR